MTSYELVKNAIEFQNPERLPFWQHDDADTPDDVLDIWEMDRAEAGWFFDNPGPDDWGCIWEATDVKNMGQVTRHPLTDWSSLHDFKPPNPRNPYYFDRIESELVQANGRYVVVTSHFNLIERLHMLRGFEKTMMDFYLAPDKVEAVLDMILEHKIELFRELHRRFGNAVHGLFLTDDWGTQQGTFISGETFEQFFQERYKIFFKEVHDLGYHAILHSCGRVNNFVPYFIDMGADVLNMQQPRAYGIEDIGKQFAGKVCFLTTVDIQSTLPDGDEEKVREEAALLVKHWATSAGGFIVFNYGDAEALNIRPEMSGIMFSAFRSMIKEGRIENSSL